MRICYLLETTDLWGGVRVVFDQARALRKRGHDVILRARGGDSGWYPYDARIEYVSDLSAPFPSGASAPDVVIATFWTTVQAALALKARATFHLCQGYEGDSSEYAGMRQNIEDAYALPIPKLTVGEWLSRRLREHFGPDAFAIHTVGQIVDLELYRPLPRWRRFFPGKDRRVRVLVSGLFDASVKAIPDALSAVSLLRKEGAEIHLTRVSTIDTREKERAFAEIEEYHCSISPGKTAEIYRMSNLFIAPSLAHEGFGLPFAEALACGVPSVATMIPSHTSFADDHDYACFVPERDPGAIAEAAMKITRETRLRNHLRKRGPAVVKKFRADLVAERLDAVFTGTLR